MATEVEVVGWKVNQTNGLRSDYQNPVKQQHSTPRWVPPPERVPRVPPGWWYRMQRSCAEPPPQCAFNSQEQQRPKDDTKGRRNHPPPSMHRINKGEPQPMSGWPPPTFENSNTSWEGDWSNASSSTPPIKTEPGYYGNRVHYPDWSPEDSSLSNYGQVSSQQYYENSNGFYGYNYGYQQQQYPGQQQQYGQLESGVPSYGSGVQRNHIPSSGYPPKMGGFEYQKKLMRYPAAEHGKVQIKREPEDSTELDSENFTSLFTKSLTSLYSQDTENAFPDDSNNSSTNNTTVNNIKPYEPPTHQMPQPAPAIEEPSTYQRLNNPGSHYGMGGNNMSTFQDMGRSSSGLGYYGRTPENPQTNVVEELGTNNENYQKPFFDTMHQFLPSESKNPAKKRKINNPSPENSYLTPDSSNSRKKTPRLAPSCPSESQWTPNSFAFSDIQIKQEPMDDYNSPSDISLQSSGGLPFKESNSPNSNGTVGNGSKSPDHPKPPPRKRSPATCFDRFEKKSTPTNKKVSPLSVYAKVQENVVLSVKCRRYKKRTKPITGKEESVCPGREEMELYKQNSLTPDQAARQVVGDLLERVELFEERSVIDGPNLSQLDAMKVRDLLIQFCHRYCLDYQDFEDINAVLRPRIVNDSAAKNSDRASAIRKRTSTISPSNVKVEVEQQPPQPAKKPSSRAEKKNDFTADKSPGVVLEPREIRRVLRNLPGRPKVIKEEVDVSPRRSYSTRSSKDISRESVKEVLVISSSTSSDSESEAGREAEVRKKSLRRLKKKKQKPAAEVVKTTPARNTRTAVRTNNSSSPNKVESRMCTRSREAMKTNSRLGKSPSITFGTSIPNRTSLRNRKDRVSRKASNDLSMSPSGEREEIKTEKSSVHEIIEAVIAESVIEKSSSKVIHRRASSAKEPDKVKEENPDTTQKAIRSSSRISTRMDSLLKRVKLEEDDWEAILRALRETEEKPRNTRRRSCLSSEVSKTLISGEIGMEASKKDFKILNDSSKRSSQKTSKGSDKSLGKSSPSSNKSTSKGNKRRLKNLPKKSSSENTITQKASSEIDQKSNLYLNKPIEIKKSDSSDNISLELSKHSSKISKIIKEEITSDDFSDEPKFTEKFTQVTPKQRKLQSTSQKNQKQKSSSKRVIKIYSSDSSEESDDLISKMIPISNVPSASKSSKQVIKSFIELSSDSSIESDEPLQVLKDRKKQVKTRSMMSRKSFTKDETKIKKAKDMFEKKTSLKCNTKLVENLPEKLSNSKPSNERAKNSNQANSSESVNLDGNAPLTKPLEVVKSLTGSQRRKATLKSDIKFIKKEKPDLPENKDSITAPISLEVVHTTPMENSDLVPTSSIDSEIPMSTQVSLEASLLKVDDLVAAVSSLVESETKSEKENEEKTQAAHSLLELGNSPLFSNVGSVATSKPEIIDLTLSSTDSSMLFKENFGRPGLEMQLSNSEECNVKSVIINQHLAYYNSTSYDKTAVNSSLIYSKNSERYEKPVAINTPYISRNSEKYGKPVTLNTPYMFSNSENYEKPIAVNTPYVFRNPDKYEKQIAVNTPYIHRSPEKYEKQVAVNTPHIYRNSDKYEKQVAVNTPYIYKNGEHQEKNSSNSSPLRPRLRKSKDKRQTRGETHSIDDKSHAAIKDNDLNNNLNKSKEVGISEGSTIEVFPSTNGNNLKATHHSSTTPKEICAVKSSCKLEMEEIKSHDINSKTLNSKTSILRNHLHFKNHGSSFHGHEPPAIQKAQSKIHSESSSSTDILSRKKTIIEEGTHHHKEGQQKLPVSENPHRKKLVNMFSHSISTHSIPSADNSQDEPMNLSRAGSPSRKKVPPCGLIKRAFRLRSESEDSDGKLVIDLDRRSSVDERAPSSPLHSPAPDRATLRSAEENEVGHTLLELTRGLVPTTEPEEKGDESILRTLLLESGAISHRALQDGSQNGSDSSINISSDSKNPLTRFLMLCKTNGEDSSTLSSSESTSVDGKKFSLEILSNLNGNSLLTDLEANHQDVKEQIRKQKSEIMYLKCAADKKDRECTVVCFKRCKKELLKRVLKKFTLPISDDVWKPIIPNSEMSTNIDSTNDSKTTFARNFLSSSSDILNRDSRDSSSVEHFSDTLLYTADKSSNQSSSSVGTISSDVESTFSNEFCNTSFVSRSLSNRCTSNSCGRKLSRRKNKTTSKS